MLRKALILLNFSCIILVYGGERKNTKLVNYDFNCLLSLADEIKRMLIASLNTAKEALNDSAKKNN